MIITIEDKIETQIARDMMEICGASGFWKYNTEIHKAIVDYIKSNGKDKKTFSEMVAESD